LCAVFGALLIGWPMQRFGRKVALIGLSIPFCVGFLLMGFTFYAQHKAQLYVGRILTGLMNGAATPASQIYVTILQIIIAYCYILLLLICINVSRLLNVLHRLYEAL
jgi:MFS family permease